MPNVKISAAADAGTLLSSDMLPLARSGDTNAYHATMAEISAFASTSVASGAYGNVGRNLLHNPLMNVQQRGTGTFTANTAGVYTADRWLAVIGAAGDTFSASMVAQNDANRAAIGDEAAEWLLSCAATGGSGASNACVLIQRIEDVYRLSGKTVTLSFYADCGTAGLKIAVNLAQNFGSGGSAGVAIPAQAVTLATTWSRYSLTFAMPSVAGKTVGAGHMTTLGIILSAGTVTAGVGVQSGVFNFWGMQLEIGSVATPLEKLDPQQDLAKCQRFYQVGSMQLYGYGQSGTTVAISNLLPVRMRGVPIITTNMTVTAGTTGAGVGALDAGSVNLDGSMTATGAFTLQGTFTASADL
jgi:invasion protein IalB